MLRTLTFISATALITLSACNQGSKSLPSETVGNKVVWSGDNGEDTPEVVLLRQEDAYVIFSQYDQEDTATDWFEESDQYSVIYSGIHVASCSEFVSDIRRQQLIEMREGERQRVKVKARYGDYVYEEKEQQDVTLNGTTHKVRVIEDEYTRLFLDAKTTEVIGFQDIESEELSYIIKIEEDAEIDPDVLSYAKENCDPGPLDD